MVNSVKGGTVLSCFTDDCIMAVRTLTMTIGIQQHPVGALNANAVETWLGLAECQWSMTVRTTIMQSSVFASVALSVTKTPCTRVRRIRCP